MSDAFSAIDKLMVADEGDASGLVWLDVKKNLIFDLYGFYDVYNTEGFIRMPLDVARATNSGVLNNASHTAGGRVRFTTNSKRVAIRAKMPSVTRFVHMALVGSSGFDLYEDNDIRSEFACAYKPPYGYTDGYEAIYNAPSAEERSYTLNFPLYSPVSKLEIGIDAGSSISAGRKYADTLPILYYGSSITQGACASRPGLCYQNIIARRTNIDYINLGFSGSARAEDVICEYMADIPMSIFICDYDHNAPNAEHLRNTHKKLYETIRTKNPRIPYIMLSRPDYDCGVADSIARRDVIIDTFRFARESGDKYVYYIDGAGIFAGHDRDSCTTDKCHPNDLGFMKMADSVGQIIKRYMRKGI